MLTNGKAAPTGECGTRPVVNHSQNQSSAPSQILQMEVPTGGLFDNPRSGDGFDDFIRSARIGDALQAIFDPTPVSRRGIISNRDLLALSRIHSESDLSLVRGFGQFLAVLSLESLLEVSEAGRGDAR